MSAAPGADVLERDVLVLGGGVTGLASAAFLSEAGVSVALLERGRIGAAGGSAAAASGLLCTGVGDHAARAAHGVGRRAAAEVVAFTEESRRLALALVERLGIECGLERRGAVALAVNAAEAEDLRATAALYEEERVAAGARLLDRAGLEALPRAPRGPAAILYPGDAALDPPALLRGLAAALREGRCGPGAVLVLEVEAAASLEAGAQGVLAALADGREVRASIAVVAANGWASMVHPFFDRVVFPTRGQGFVTAPLPPLLERPYHAGWGHELVRQRADGRLAACGFRPDPGEEDTSLDDRPTEVFQGFLARFLCGRVPGLPAPADLPVERRFAGTCGFSQDGLPLLGPLPGQPALLAACGFTMRGLSLGFAAGRAVARLVTRGERSYPACLAAGRFL